MVIPTTTGGAETRVRFHEVYTDPMLTRFFTRLEVVQGERGRRNPRRSEKYWTKRLAVFNKLLLIAIILWTFEKKKNPER